MSGAFTSDWLSLRAPADARARNPAVRQALSDWAAGRERLAVVDLGGGTGATLRALAPHLPPSQRWRVVDVDADLLSNVARNAPDGVTVETEVRDLKVELEDAVRGADLVTCSAFLDLCGARWLDRLADALAAEGAAFYAALTYDGRELWRPQAAEDAAILAHHHDDMTRDKGLGPALGGGAHPHLARALDRHGLRVAEGGSDWELERPRDARLIAELASGFTAFLPESAPDAVRRRAETRGATAETVRIGHADLLALPRG